MTRWIQLSVVAVAFVLVGDRGTSVAQVISSQPMDQPAIVTPSTPSSPPRFVSRFRFEPRPDVRQLPGPLHVSGRVPPPFGVVTFWPGNRVMSTQILTTPTPLEPSSENDLRGGLQLDVQPWGAQVYVDGAYVGLVKSFTGYYSPLGLVPGPHVITIVALDYDPLTFDVVVSPGRTTTYRGTLSRASGR